MLFLDLAIEWIFRSMHNHYQHFLANGIKINISGYAISQDSIKKTAFAVIKMGNRSANS